MGEAKEMDLERVVWERGVRARPRGRRRKGPKGSATHVDVIFAARAVSRRSSYMFFGVNTCVLFKNLIHWIRTRRFLEIRLAALARSWRFDVSLARPPRVRRPSSFRIF